MFLRMVLGAVFRQKSKMFMIAFTVALGVSLSTAMLNTMPGNAKNMSVTRMMQSSIQPPK